MHLPEERPMDRDEILLDTEERMEKAATVLHDQLQGVRTGRATPGLVDTIRVDVYGSDRQRHGARTPTGDSPL